MEVKCKTEMTPNPNALKFVTNVTVINEDRISYESIDECEGNPLAQSIFELPNVTMVHFFENVITVTQNGSSDWSELESSVKDKLIEKIPSHDPNLTKSASSSNVEMTPEIQKINEILDNTIRPYLQGDGGDLEVLGLENNRLVVRYQGACGGCPSATMGTLQAIEGVLREQFHPELEVHAM